MRDSELQQEFKRQTPRLDKIFSKVLRTFPGDRAVQVKDLLQETIEKAVLNSRLPQYDDYTCEQLIYLKAFNVLYEYCHPPRKKVPAIPLEESEYQASQQDIHGNLVNRQWLESIYRKVDRQTWLICYLDYAGYKQEEIATRLRLTVPAVKMKLYRMRQRMDLNS
jgi:DNA-directed RNA polymerase specialized sigma24 family protein